MDPETKAFLFTDKLKENNTLEIEENEIISPTNFHNNNFQKSPLKEIETDGLWSK